MHLQGHLSILRMRRLFLRKLKQTLKIPVLALVDSDPYGLKILSVYMKGSHKAVLSWPAAQLFSALCHSSDHDYLLSD